MFVNACFSYLDIVSSANKKLTSEIEALTGTKLRRTDRFTQLAMLGAHSCIKGVSLPEETGIVLATSAGTVATTIEMMSNIGAHNLLPKPFQFVNSLGNSACFFLARSLGLTGPSVVVSQELSSFESALLHAELLITHQGLTDVLVGGVDEAPAPAVMHLCRNNASLDEYSACYEGSHWLCLSASKKENPIAKIRMLANQIPIAASNLLLAEQRELFADALLIKLTDHNNSEEKNWGGKRIFPHGVYSGHHIVQACRKLKNQGKSIAIVQTLDYSGEWSSLTLIESVG